MSSMAMSPVVLVTGATDGIGKETARLLALRGAQVVVHGRTAKSAENARRAIEAATGKALPAAVHADLSSLDEVRALAEAWGSGPLDVLLHNAGVFMTERRLTPDGRELTMAVNHDAPFLLSHLLRPSLERAPQGRLVFVSSVAHSRAVLDLTDLDFARRFDGYAAYAASKLANVLCAVELARRLASTRITANALHPGVVSTKLLQTGFGMRGSDSLAAGSATSVHLALDEVGVSGRYFVSGRPAQPSAPARDAVLARQFYEVSCARVGISPLPSP